MYTYSSLYILYHLHIIPMTSLSYVYPRLQFVVVPHVFPHIIGLCKL